MTAASARPGHGILAAAIGPGVRRQAPWWLLIGAAGATVASLPAAQAGWGSQLGLVGLPAALAWPLTLAGLSQPWALAVISWVASPWAVGPVGAVNVEYPTRGGAVLTWPVTHRSRRCYRLTLLLFGATLANSWWPALWADGLPLPVALAGATAAAAATTSALHLATRRRFRRPTPR
jgi:hypothetical protein